MWITVVADSKQPYNSFNAKTRDRLVAHGVELEYGVADRLSLGGYLDFEDARGQPLRFTEGRIEARYRVANRQDLFVNPGLYLEYYVPRKGGGEQELEVRFIADKDLNDFRLAANPRLEFETTGPDATVRRGSGSTSASTIAAMPGSSPTGIPFRLRAGGRLEEPVPLYGTDARHRARSAAHLACRRRRRCRRQARRLHRAEHPHGRVQRCPPQPPVRTTRPLAPLPE